jgi:hypothetical protein
VIGAVDDVSTRLVELASSLGYQLISEHCVFVASCTRSVVHVSPQPDLDDACCGVV